VRRGGAAIAIVATWLAAAAILALGTAIAIHPDLFLGALGKDATLTGRTKIWAAVWRLIQARPLLGYGYSAVWTNSSVWGPLQWVAKEAGFAPQHAHNSWLEQWLGLGEVGLVAWSMLFVSVAAKSLWAVYRRDGGLLVFPYLVVFSLMSLTESTVMVYNDMRWVIFVAFAVRLSIPLDAGSATASLQPRAPPALTA
jgi:O-antigen ligase